MQTASLGTIVKRNADGTRLVMAEVVVPQTGHASVFRALQDMNVKSASRALAVSVKTNAIGKRLAESMVAALP